MATTKISQAEATRLLELLKHSLKDAIDFPSQGTATEFNVVSNTTNDSFVVNIYRGKVNRLKYNLGARIKKNGILLLELHVGGPSIVHSNPDGEKIHGSHWHIYTEQYGRSLAYPAEDIESDKFVENTIAFLDRFHVIEPPIINFQTELL